MNQQHQWVGIDVCKAWLDVALHPSQVSFRLSNTMTGQQALVEKLAPLSIAGVVLEATGGLEGAVMGVLQQQGYGVSRVLPNAVRAFAKAKRQLAKTDKLDAQALAEFGAVLTPAPTPPVDAATQALQALVTRRRQVVSLLTIEKNRLASCPESVRASIEQVIALLEAHLRQLEAQIEQQSQQQADWQAQLHLLTSVPGIGKVIGQALLVLLPELGKVSGKTIAALVGVAPFNRDSGRFRGQRHISGGRTDVRCLLYMATLTAVRHNPTIRAHYQQLLQRGKLKKVALIACLRKLLGCLTALMRDRQPWRHSEDLQPQPS